MLILANITRKLTGLIEGWRLLPAFKMLLSLCKHMESRVWSKISKVTWLFFLRLANSSTYFKSKGETRRGWGQFLGNVITICSPYKLLVTRSVWHWYLRNTFMMNVMVSLISVKFSLKNLAFHQESRLIFIRLTTCLIDLVKTDKRLLSLLWKVGNY